MMEKVTNEEKEIMIEKKTREVLDKGRKSTSVSDRERERERDLVEFDRYKKEKERKKERERERRRRRRKAARNSYDWENRECFL